MRQITRLGIRLLQGVCIGLCMGSVVSMLHLLVIGANLSAVLAQAALTISTITLSAFALHLMQRFYEFTIWS